VGVDRTPVSSYDKLPPGKHSIVLTFKYDGGGIGKGGLATLSVDGKKVAERKLARTIPFRVSADETLDIGEDTGGRSAKITTFPSNSPVPSTRL
jgi:hypothetical protein